MDRKRLRAFLLGGAAGLIAGAIFAPRSGRELRGSIAERAGETREMGRETLFEAQERLRERRAAAREGAYRSAPLSVGDDAPRDPAPQPERRDDVVSLAFDGAPGGTAGRETERSEELRRKVRETRARLRATLDVPRADEESPER